MTDDQLIEEVALAMLRAHCGQQHMAWVPETLDQCAQPDFYRTLARAAIAAMQPQELGEGV